MLPHHSARRVAGLLTAAALLILAGCSSTVTQSYLYRSGVMNSFMYAASGRDMEVVVAGNPFTMSKNEVDRVVVDSMQGQNNGPLTHFTLSPGQDSKLGYRIVVALNPPASFPAADACTSNPGTIPTTPTGGRLRALMAFCAKDSILSEATGSVVPVARPTDGDFGPLMAALIRDLVPAREPNDDSQSVIVGMK